MKDLELIIQSHQEQADKGNLTALGLEYLKGLKRAKQIIEQSE